MTFISFSLGLSPRGNGPLLISFIFVYTLIRVGAQQAPSALSSPSSAAPTPYPTWSDCVSMISFCRPWSEFIGQTHHTETVRIPCEVCVTMEEFAHGELIDLEGGLDIEGRLLLPDGTSLTLRTPYIFVQGELFMRSTKKIDGNPDIKVIMTGTEDAIFYPHARNKVELEYENNNPENGFNVGKKAILVAGGKIDIQGFPEYATTWENAIHILRDVPPTPEEYPRPPISSGCISTFLSESDGQMIMVKNNTWHHLFDMNQFCDVEPKITYTFTSRIRLVNKKLNGERSQCSSRGRSCALLSLFRTTGAVDVIHKRSIAFYRKREEIADGEWFDFNGEFTLTQGQVRTFSHIIFDLLEEDVDIEVSSFEIGLPAEAVQFECNSDYLPENNTQTVTAKNNTSHQYFNINENTANFCNIQSRRTYLFKSKIRLVNKKLNGARSECSITGDKCVGLSLFRTDIHGQTYLRQMALMSPSEAVSDGEWFTFQGEISLNEVQSKYYDKVVLDIPEEEIDIEVMNFQIISPPIEGYPDENSVCDNLAVNGDAERDNFPFPMKSLLSDSTLVVKQEENGNSYFHLGGRTKWWSSLTFDLTPGCLVDNSIYHFSARIWIHSDLPIKSAAILKVTNPDKTFFFKMIKLCPLSSESIGWIDCNVDVIFDERFFTASKVQFLLSPQDGSLDDIDMDDISFSFVRGTQQTIKFSQNVTNAWAPGAAVLVTSQTFNWDEEQLLEIESVDEQGNVKFTRNFMSPVSLEEEPEYAGEFALLSRNIVFEIEYDDTEEPYHGGHLMIYKTPHCIGIEGRPSFECDGHAHRIEGVAFYHFGQEGIRSRYVSVSLSFFNIYYPSKHSKPLINLISPSFFSSS